MKGSRQPLLPDVGVLALVADRWSPRWMRRHHMLTRLARYFPVVWMNPAVEWRETLRMGKLFSPTDCPAAQSPAFSVYTPEVWLPKLHRPQRLANLLFDQRLKRARRLLTKWGCKRIILYICRPYFERALHSIAFDLSTYHIDDEYSFSDVELPFDEREKRVIASVDQVFVHSTALLQKKGSLNQHTALVPNGVDYHAFACRAPEPADLMRVPRPRIGYTGYIKKQLDWPLLLQLARRHVQWSFVFVGAQNPHPEVQEAIQALSGQRNAYFLGEKPTQELAVYPQHFDVCIMPYRVNDYTKYIYPLKLHEYLASGQPTVGTHICPLDPFADVVKLASTPEGWSDSIGEALSPAANTPASREARQAVARQHDWQPLADQMAEVMMRRLGNGYLARWTDLRRSSD